jgi:hypothetical protein
MYVTVATIFASKHLLSLGLALLHQIFGATVFALHLFRLYYYTGPGGYIYFSVYFYIYYAPQTMNRFIYDNRHIISHGN